MRISVLKDDPDYHPLATKCTAFIDGRKVSWALSADEEKGEVLCYKLNENGKLDRDSIKQRVTLKGKVYIEFPINFDD